jgi:hypothetical protein
MKETLKRTTLCKIWKLVQVSSMVNICQGLIVVNEMTHVHNYHDTEIMTMVYHHHHHNNYYHHHHHQHHYYCVRILLIFFSFFLLHISSTCPLFTLTVGENPHTWTELLFALLFSVIMALYLNFIDCVWFKIKYYGQDAGCRMQLLNASVEEQQTVL